MSEPTDAELRALKRMDPIKWRAVVRRLLELWNHNYGRATFRGGYLRLATGGWSDNEALIGHLPPMFYMFYWWMSKRGGLHVYRFIGFKPAKADQCIDLPKAGE